MLLDIILLVVGLTLILVGANYMTDGAVAIAKRFGMSDFMVGLTIVAMMTSAPELVVSLTSAVNASPSMAIGNLVGSNIFNVLVIIGVVAIVSPIQVTRSVMVNEIPLMVLSSVALLVMGLSPYLDGGPMVVSRVDGLLLLLFFIVFMRYTFSAAKRMAPVESDADTSPHPLMPLWRALLLTCGGLAALILGGNWFVDGASGVAASLGWSQALIGLTILAAGTSLPELAASIAAAMKGFPGMCVGNVIGSNIFNIFMVMGVTSTVMPLPFGDITLVDLLVLNASALLFWLFGWAYKHRTITRIEGVVMVLCYIAYMTYLYFNISQ